MTARAAPPTAQHWTGVTLDAPARSALAAFGDALRAPDGAWAAEGCRGAPLETQELESHIGPEATGALVAAGLAVQDAGRIWLAATVSDVGGVLTAIPTHGWGDEIVYLGEDSTYLVEAALRLAPRGARAADLGTGTGLAAAVLGSRYRVVVGTDLAPSVTVAAALTVALNRFPDGHAVGMVQADISSGLREDAFDLVVANAPWVPLAAGSTAPRELFAHGGDHGVELPARFLRAGAALLRAGGLAITLALDVEVAGRHRPLDEVCEELASQGYLVERVPTPFNQDRPHLPEITRARQPDLTGATHVAVVVARPRPDDPARASLRVAVDALRRRWDPASGHDPTEVAEP